MKVVMITDTYPPNVNGAALATERLAQELVKRNHQVVVIAPSTSFKSHVTHQKNLTIYRLRSIPVLLERTQEFRVSPKPLHDKELRKIIRDVRPDIIHVNEPWLMGLSGISIGKEEGIPVIATHHFMPENLVHYLHLPPKIEDLIHRTIWRWYAGLCKKFDLVICPTQSAADLVSKYGSEVKLEVISNGIDLRTFNKKNDGMYLKKVFNLPDIPLLLFVGRLEKEKHINVLLEAAALVKEKISFHLVIVGQGKEKIALKNLAEQLGIASDVTFTGLLPGKDLPNMYTVCDIFVMPSTAELQSLVTMEAMASGLPIVAANAVALPHLVHDGRNGFLFNPKEVQDFADKLLKLLKDQKLREKMGKESLEIIKAHDMQKIVIQIESAYKRTIEQYSSKPL